MTTHKMDQSELLNLHTSSEKQSTHNQNSNSEIVERIQVEGTPFLIVGNEDNGYFVTLGSYRVSENYTKQNCYKLIETVDWMLLLSVINATVTALKNYYTETDQELDVIRIDKNGKQVRMTEQEFKKWVEEHPTE